MRCSSFKLYRGDLHVCHLLMTFANSLDANQTRQNPRGSSLIFSNIRRLGSFFWVQNFEFQYFFFLGGGGSEK